MLRMRNWNAFLTVSIFASLPFFFQNCTSPHFQSDKFSLTGGTGADGLTFKMYALCPDNKIEVANTLIVSSDRQTAFYSRQNCQDLSSPLPIAVSELHFSNSDPTVLQVNNQVFDQQIIGSSQKVTLQYCVADSVQSFIWEQVGNAAQVYGSVVPTQGSSSGPLNILAPPMGSSDFITIAGQSSQFNLNLNVTPATLSYAIGSVPPVLVSSMSCASQLAPVTPPDGSGQAPAGSPQENKILANYPLRAPWKVAGVDYATGYPNTIVLKDPFTDLAVSANPSITIDSQNKIFHIAGSNVTLDGYDFGSYSISVDSGNNTIVTNSKITMISTSTTTSNLTVTYCLIDGSLSAPQWALIYNRGSGALVVQYNWLKNFTSTALHNEASTGTLQFKNNLIEDGGANSSGDDIYLGPGTYSSVVVEFNTFFEPNAGNMDEAINFHASNMNAAGDIAYNTLIAAPVSGKRTMSYMIHVAGNASSSATFQIHDNYMDPQGAYGPFFQTPNGNGTQLTLSNNFNMSNSQALPNTL